MSQLTQHPAYVMIEDRLDVIGQKYRVQRLLRGLMLWLTSALAATIIAAAAAHYLAGNDVTPGHTLTIRAMLFTWAAWLITSATLWILRPLIFRPTAIEMARLIESRIGGLNNGLTNSVLLARAEDLQDNPYLPGVLDEILLDSREKPLDGAVGLRDLKWLGIKVAGALLLIAIGSALFAKSLNHGFRQLLSPTAFVPTQGNVQILDVQPIDSTIVTGEPLEISVLARASNPNDEPVAWLSFQPSPPGAQVLPVRTPEGDLRYTYRIEHVDQTTQFRAEIDGTQSPWYTINVVKQVKLTTLQLTITPPTYAQAVMQAQSLTLKPDDIAKSALTAAQGSTVDITASVDVPIGGAMLQVGEAAPVAMQLLDGGLHCSGSIRIVDDSNVSILLTQGGNIIARLPENGLHITCVKDEPPKIVMHWPTQDTSVAPTDPVILKATLADDYGISNSRVLMSTASEGPLAPVDDHPYVGNQQSIELTFPLKLTDDQKKHGQSVRVQIEATDNRALTDCLPAGGPQTVQSPVFEIKFRDPAQLAADQKEQTDKLRAALMEMLKQQRDLNTSTVAFKPNDKDRMSQINTGQSQLRALMANVAQNYTFSDDNKVIQSTLYVLIKNPASEAVDLSAAINNEPVEKEQLKLQDQLALKQRAIINVLEHLLSTISANPEPATQATTRASDPLLTKADKFEKLDEALKQFMKEQQRILDQTANLAKKPTDDYTDADKKLLEDLKMAQEKLDAFMEQKLNDFSKLSQQDMSNADLVQQLMEIYSEVTMAKDALKGNSPQIAVPEEEGGLEGAKELSNNLEKWLMDHPDRAHWTQEDLLAKNDPPMAELPKELEDMVGKLMEQEEDLMDEAQDQSANMADSIDKGTGWDASDGPIANMSANGITGNQLPKDNEMNGRSGEGRSGKSSGEFVEDHASGKGGRMTPTRLDPTPFQKGQVKDDSKDPVGGATGGGKVSGQGGQGLEGPVPPKMKEQMQRLAQKQAELRNNAERLNLKYQLGRYDNFKLTESIGLMRQVESNLNANRYQNAMRRRDLLLDSLDTSRLLLGGQLNVEQDTTAGLTRKSKEELDDAMKGGYPAAWSDALQDYYKKLSAE